MFDPCITHQFNPLYVFDLQGILFCVVKLPNIAFFTYFVFIDLALD